MPNKRTKAIGYVLSSFVNMGANEAQLIREKTKLENDDYYLAKWLNVTGGDFILREASGFFEKVSAFFKKFFK
jgi:hypothetical protein